MTRQAPPRHPAKFSDSILEVLGRLLVPEIRSRRPYPITVLDPFAGVGRVHRLARPGRVITTGMELEPEWASAHEGTIQGDSLELMATFARELTDPRDGYDVIVTSPTYGNRFADHHDAQDGSTRRSYAHDLGRLPTAGSSAVMHWGPKYWAFHGEAYRLMLACLRPGGLLLLNVSDFYRDKALVPAVAWHRGALYGAGYADEAPTRLVDTPRMNYGENRERAGAEMILRLRRPATVIPTPGQAGYCLACAERDHRGCQSNDLAGGCGCLCADSADIT